MFNSKTSKIKILFLIIFSFIFCIYSFATTASYEGKNYEIKLIYNKEFCPGDPIIVQMQFKFLGKLSKLPKDEKVISGKIRLVNSDTDKNLRSSTLFEMKSKKETL